MKHRLLVVLLLFVSIATMADSSILTVQDLIKDRGQFLDNRDFYKKQVLKGSSEEGTEFEISANDIRDILELNVVSYFNIKGYDTALKKELYKETEEYKQYETELKKIN